MFVIPSIDILNGKCVQLINGKIETTTVYGDPKKIADWNKQFTKDTKLVLYCA